MNNEPLTLVNIEDLNIKFVELTRGKYLIDNEIIDIEGSGIKLVAVNNMDDIRIVSETKVIEKYTDGENFKSKFEYQSEKTMLLTKKHDDDNDDSVFNTLEDEYNYKKFIQTWDPIYKTIQSISDPIKVAVEKIKYDTGNKYIEATFFNPEKYTRDINIYKYDRKSAIFMIISECFSELGYSFESRDVDTFGKKIWINRHKDTIKYTKAFGKYIFDEDISLYPIYGILDDLIIKYNKDKEYIRKIIITEYKIHNETFDLGNFDVKEIMEKLGTLKNQLNKIDSKKTTIFYLNEAISTTNKLIDMITTIINNKEK